MSKKISSELVSTIDNLYFTFSSYPLKEKIEGCPCCVSGSDKLKLHSAPLKELISEDLNRYSHKAMTTWGDIGDFKHFLPRIFELMATDEGFWDTHILWKLNYGKWREWSEEEQKSIRNFLVALWSDIVKNTDDLVRTFLDISELFGDADLLLKEWVPSFADCSFHNLIEFIYWEFNRLNTEKKLFNNKVSVDTINKINHWLSEKKNIIEEGYFYFEKSDPKFAEQISVCLDIVKNIPN